MIRRSTGFWITVAFWCAMPPVLWSAAEDRPSAEPARWRPPAHARPAATGLPAGGVVQAAAHQDSAPSPVSVAGGTNMLPNDHGQVWREYDLSPYTSRVKNQEKPEQAVIDWILRETGTEAWFSEPLGLLCATRDKLRVYHTREMQATVSNIVSRFVSNAAKPQAFGLRLISLGNPSWRTKAQQMLHAVTVQTPGVEAWLLSKEDAALLVSELRQRSDAVEQNSPNLLLQHGQTHTIQRTRPLPYVRSVQRRPGGWPPYQLQMGQIEEGITVQLSPLLSRDQGAVDAVLKVAIVQVEKFSPIWIDVPTTVDPRQRTQVQVPQVSTWNLHERFRWPANQVLLISCGMVPAPAMARPSRAGLPTMLFGPARADALLLVEVKGPTDKPLEGPARELRTGNLHYRGRY